MTIDGEQRGPEVGINYERREKLVKKKRKRQKKRKNGMVSMLIFSNLT